MDSSSVPTSQRKESVSIIKKKQLMVFRVVMFIFWRITRNILYSVDRASPYIYVIKTNLKHYLSSVYFVNQPLNVSGIFVAHHQEVYYIYIQQLVRIVHFS